MKEVCKNCEHAKPTYKGNQCELTRKRVKTTHTCENFREKSR
jgi:hypothetical protein